MWNRVSKKAKETITTAQNKMYRRVFGISPEYLDGLKN